MPKLFWHFWFRKDIRYTSTESKNTRICILLHLYLFLKFFYTGVPSSGIRNLSGPHVWLKKNYDKNKSACYTFLSWSKSGIWCTTLSVFSCVEQRALDWYTPALCPGRGEWQGIFKYLLCPWTEAGWWLNAWFIKCVKWLRGGYSTPIVRQTAHGCKPVHFKMNKNVIRKKFNKNSYTGK